MLVFKTFLTDNNDVNDNTTYTQRSVFNTSPSINESGFSVSTSAITVPEAGVYMCYGNFYFTTGVSRSNVGVSFGINGTKQDEESGSDYIRGDQGHEEASTALFTTYDLSANDTINLFFARLANSGTVTLSGDQSSVSLVRVG